MPIDREDLRKRRWPKPPFPIGHEVRGRKIRGSGIIFYDDVGNEIIAGDPSFYANLSAPANYLESHLVSEGKIKIIPLGKKKVTGSLPPEECAITSLVKDREGRIYIASSGRKSHLLLYDSKREPNYAIHLGVLEKEESKINSLVVSSDGSLFGGTELKNGEGYLFSCIPSEEAPLKIEKVAVPIKNEGISALTIDNNLGRIYGLSTKTGTFFIFYLKKGTVELKGPVDKEGIFSEVLVVGPERNVYGGARWGQLFRYDIEKESLISLKSRIPSVRGREMYDKIDSLIFDKEGQSLYGGTFADGMLFQFYPQEEKIISLGKVIAQPRIRCLAFGKNGCLYGVAGETCCHLFRYNPEDRDLVDLGIPFVSSPRHWYGYEFDAAVSGENGEIFLGQSERISYLFLYFP